MTGRIFDITEFCLHDGPGIRTTVFLKGCPLRCQWCHNPEGQRFEKELMVSLNGCTGCGACQRACPSGARCTACGTCVTACPHRLRRVAGMDIEAAALAERILRDRDVFEQSGGGATLSGGEALAQPEFLLELLERLAGVHTALDTSGYAPETVFREAAKLSSMILYDVKLLDPEAHLRYTGVDNRPILDNLDWLCGERIPFIVRVPLIPGVNDGAFLEALADRLAGAQSLVQVDLLPYNKAAGAKYPMTGRTYRVDFDEDRPLRCDLDAFDRRGIKGVLQ